MGLPHSARDDSASWPQLANVARSAVVLLACLAILVLVGWHFGIESLKRVAPGWVAMNPTTALGFLMSGLAVALACRAPNISARSLGLIRILGLMVAAFGVINLVRCMGGPDLHIDQWLYQLESGASEYADAALRSSRVAPNTALLFILFGIALVLMHLNHALWRVVANGIAVFGAIIAMVGALGYWNGVASLYRPTAQTPMALHTALGFIILAVSLLCCGYKAQDTQQDVEGGEADLFPVHRKMTIGFVTALFVLAVIGIVSLASLQSLVNAHQAAERSHRVLESISQLSAVLSDAETSERGFMLTGNGAFIDSYHNAFVRLEAELAKLGELFAEDAYQQAKFAELAALVGSEWAFLQPVSAETGSLEGHRQLSGDAGKTRLDAVRGVLEAMRSHELGTQHGDDGRISRVGNVTVMVISAGALLAFVLVGAAGWLIRRDLLHKQHVATALRLAQRRADDANEAKSRFLANMSHEIRTPISAIIGYADLVMDPKQSASDRINHIHTIRRNSEHLLSLINDILDLSKIESGGFEVERIACSPSQVLFDVTSLMRIRAIEKNIQFVVSNDGPVPVSVMTDPVRLRQVLINLVGNAIKFTDEGYVKLIVRLEEPADSPARLRFEIMDTGVGMSEQEIGRLFQPFVQADNSTTRRFGGTGLGLTISKRLVEMLGGSISVQSIKGRGSTFTFTIDTGSLVDVPRMDSCHEAVMGSEVMPGESVDMALDGDILLVEDGEDNRRLLSLYLQAAGARVVTAANGRIAVEKAMKAMGDGRPFDLILMDMQLPELDGYSATSLLRAKGYGAPIIALTANAMNEDRGKCLSAGCTEYLSKPVCRDKLLSVVGGYVKSHATADQKAGADSSGEQAGTIFSELSDPSLLPLLRKYVEELPERVEQMATLMRAGDMEELKEMVHNLKGTGGLYGLMAISDAAMKVEERLLCHASMATVGEAVEELSAVIGRVDGVARSEDVGRAEANELGRTKSKDASQ